MARRGNAVRHERNAGRYEREGSGHEGTGKVRITGCGGGHGARASIAGYATAGGILGAVARHTVTGVNSAPVESRPRRAVSAVSIVCSALPGAPIGADAFRTAPAGVCIEFSGALTAFGTSGYGRAGLVVGGGYAHGLGTVVRAAGIYSAAVHLVAANPGPIR